MSPAAPPTTIAAQYDPISATPGSQVEDFSWDNNDEDFLHQRLSALLTRQNTSTLQNAERPPGEDVSADEAKLTPNHEARREGFTWDMPPVQDTDIRPRRNPVPPKAGLETPPPLEEVLRRKTNEDADSIQNASLPNHFHDDRSSILPRTGTHDISGSTLERSDTSRSSIAGFAQGIAKRFPDLRMFPQPGKLPSQTEDRARRTSQGAESAMSDRRERKLSFILPSSLKLKSTILVDQASPIVEVTEGIPKPSACVTQKESLKDRRKVKLDLELPVAMPELPPRSRVAIDHLSSITPSRPRSPKTPWIRNEPPQFHQEGFPTKAIAAPITTEDYIGQIVMDSGHMDILPGNDLISSSYSPELERIQQTGRDRCYVSRPLFKRNRSGKSGTSESTLARTPDGNWTPDETQAQKEQQARTTAELQELGRADKRSRSRRWRFTSPFSSANRSSDDTPLASPLPTRRRFSINPFKRAFRTGDESDFSQRKPHPSGVRDMQTSKDLLSRRGQTNPLSQMLVPPRFVPPGLNRVPTPPSLDDHREIKGKLADFFFDHGNGVGRRQPKASPEGYWDSDALLMSYLSTDIDQNEEDSEEGPEGPRAAANASLSMSIDLKLTQGTPGLVSTPGGYLSAKGRYIAPPDSRFPNTGDMWFRIQQDEHLDESSVTASALREEDERRKFEWLIPEHLPSSPLCPLHKKYQGYSKGACLWHRRGKSKSASISRKRGETTRVRDSSQQYRPSQVSHNGATKTKNKGNAGRVAAPAGPKVELKKRRLASLSSP